ncbi:MAG: hypothetical protein WBP81_36345 [Solirubrobacteraceae bacterium]
MSTTDLNRTAFDEVQRGAGADWTDWEGWAWAADFGDPGAEHQATRTACNMWDESALRKWDLRGKDALALADALFTNDVAALELGQVRYGAICDEHGKIVMDGTIFHVAEGHCLSVTSYDSDLDRRGHTALLPLHQRRRDGRRGTGVAIAHRLFRRARVRALLPTI